jgi:hypothetical protein
MDWTLRGIGGVAIGVPENLPHPVNSSCQAWLFRADDRTSSPHSIEKVNKFESAVCFKFTTENDSLSESEKVYGTIREGSVVQCPVL